jgi:hypothetical protein
MTKHAENKLNRARTAETKGRGRKKRYPSGTEEKSPSGREEKSPGGGEENRPVTKRAAKEGTKEILAAEKKREGE